MTKKQSRIYPALIFKLVDKSCETKYNSTHTAFTFCTTPKLDHVFVDKMAPLSTKNSNKID